MSDTAVTLKPTELLKVNELKTAVHELGDWMCWVKPDVPLERILLPGYWANHARHLKPGAKITVLREDFTLDVQLRVIKSDPGLVVVRIIGEPYVDDTDMEAYQASLNGDGVDENEIPAGYKLGYAPKGAVPGHFVQLNATGESVIRGLRTRRGALEAAKAHALASITVAKGQPQPGKGGKNTEPANPPANEPAPAT